MSLKFPVADKLESAAAAIVLWRPFRSVFSGVERG